MNRNVLSAYTTSDGIVVSNACKLRHIHLTSDSNAGSIILRDGGASGDIKFQSTLPDNKGIEDIPMPSDGIRFDTNIHIALTGADSVTLLYSPFDHE